MFFKKKTIEKPVEEKEEEFYGGMFATHNSLKKFSLEATLKKSIQLTAENFKAVDNNGKEMALDASSLQQQKALFGGFNANIPSGQINWYAGQGFIGYQLCAILAQNWLIDKACTMPARDAVRNGFDITVNDGTKVPTEVLDFMRAQDKKYKLNKNLVEFMRFGRIFGIRIAMFKIDNIDYEKPFNLDGIQPGSYRGIVQVDPYWITPELDIVAASEPASLHYYEPTWWRVNGKRIHRSHLIIMRACEVADLLKPSYLWGGISVPQRIYERVYAAERTANEMPMLAMTKRMITYQMDMTSGIANQSDLEAKVTDWVNFMNNFGIKLINSKEKIEQHETSLSGLDETVMTQYQIVAGAANVPITKLLGTVPKGFNSTGEFEEASYHEELESAQEHELTPLIQRHHAIVIRSDVADKFPAYRTAPFETTVAWKSLDSMTAKELSEVNQAKAETGLKLQQAGAIDGEDERQRLINDPDSGYNGMPERVTENPLFENEPVENLENPEAEGSTNIPVRPSTPVQGAKPDDESTSNKEESGLGKSI